MNAGKFYNWLVIPILVVALITGCSSGYQITRSNRVDYPVDNRLAMDSISLKTYLPYKKQLDEQMNQVLGYSEVSMVKNNDLPESVLGNFLADAVLQQALKYDPAIDFTMPSTKGGLRADLPKGSIKLTNLFELMPFENELYVFKLKGADVQDLINFIAASNGQPVAGLRMKIAAKKPMEVFIQGKPFDPLKVYKVLSTDYIAGGGDSTIGFMNPIEKRQLNLKLRDALINYVKASQLAGKTITAKLDGRISKN